MKTIFTLLLATIFTSAFAYDESRLTITVSDNSNVQVMIDNRAYRLNDNSLVLTGIQSGRHTVQVYRNSQGNNSRGYGTNRNKNNRNEMLYSSTIYVKPNYDVDIMINRFGKALVDERDLRYNNDDWRNNDRRYDRNDNNGGYGNYPNDRNYNQAMSQYEFDQLVQKIRSQWFGSGKMNTTKEALNRNYFTTQQVRQLLNLFSSENDKLELAKLAYRNTVDQKNYSQLYDVFSSRNSREELDQYVRNYRW